MVSSSVLRVGDLRLGLRTSTLEVMGVGIRICNVWFSFHARSHGNISRGISNPWIETLSINMFKQVDIYVDRNVDRIVNKALQRLVHRRHSHVYRPLCRQLQRRVCTHVCLCVCLCVYVPMHL